MQFNSIVYIIFLVTVLLLVRLTPQTLRWGVLLAASGAFYCFLKMPYLIFAIVFVISVTFCCGKFIHSATCSKRRTYWLWGGIVANLSLLIWLKYLPFLVDNINHLLVLFPVREQIAPVQTIVSIGASYYVFQAISYLVDIYLELLEPETHPGYLALYLSFFPKLLQGPIERGSHLLVQLRSIPNPNLEGFQEGLHLFIWGVFKKVVVADRLASYVDVVYQDVHHYSGLSLILATYMYALQLYFDFSGYTDMALGSARMFNIRLTQNFNMPYAATSIQDFWRRWHISFSSWILDYIFKPLQFRFRNNKWGTQIALLVTFIISGFWHGASWCFIVWGTVHGVYLAASSVIQPRLNKLYKRHHMNKNLCIKFANMFITFHLVCFAWIFFRANSLDEAYYVIWSSVTGLPQSLADIVTDYQPSLSRVLLVNSLSSLIGLLILVSLSLGLESMKLNAKNDSLSGELGWIIRLPCWLRSFVYAVVCYLVVFYGASTQSFIYLQF